MNEFFVVALPGIEDIVKAEIGAWFPELEAVVMHGGVSVRAPLEIGLSMNLCLKTATRILLRVETFKCSDFPKLFNTVKSIAWSRWVDPRRRVVVHASTRLSRLKIKRRIEETCEEGWAAHRKSLGPEPVLERMSPVELYARIADNRCTLSLDTSGERLHKRGVKTLVGEAPLRETIAAALIQMVGASDPEAADVEVVDPMMGSGTFLIEAATRDLLIEARDFAEFKVAEIPQPRLMAARPRVSSLAGYESSTPTFRVAVENLSAVTGQLNIPSLLHNEDCFKAEPLPKAVGRRWLFCNPPYGERLKVRTPLQDLYNDLFAACERLARPDRACFLLPTKAVKGKFRLPVGWKVVEKRPFLNGGIPVTAFVFARKPAT